MIHFEKSLIIPFWGITISFSIFTVFTYPKSGLIGVSHVKAFRFKLIYKLINPEVSEKPYFETHGTSLHSEKYGWKRIWEGLDPNSGESTFTEDYYLQQKKTRIRITPEQKKYEQWSDPNDIHGGIGRDAVAFLKRAVGSNYKSLGIKTIDGNQVELFQTKDPNWALGYFKNPQVDAKIWADVKTRLPSRSTPPRP